LNAVPIDVIAIVLGAALLHAAWNAIAKGWHGSDSLVSAFAIAAGAAIVAAGMLLVLGWPNARRAATSGWTRATIRSFA
jgi:hypothetical protein